MFLSEVFTQSFVNATGVPVELYQSDGSIGAALGAGVGAKIFSNPQEAFVGRKPLALVEPTQTATYDALYSTWKDLLQTQLQKTTSYKQTVNV